MHHVSGTVHYLIIICGTLMQNDDISRYFFNVLKKLIFCTVSGVKGQKIVQNEKQQLHLSPTISWEQYSI